MILAALVVVALSLRAEVFSEPLCENLPEVSPEVKTWVAQVAPEFAQVRVRELPEQTALDVFRRAAASGWGSIDVLTHGDVRRNRLFYLRALRGKASKVDVQEEQLETDASAAATSSRACAWASSRERSSSARVVPRPATGAASKIVTG